MITGILLSILCALLSSIGLLMVIYWCMLLYIWLIGLGLSGIVILTGILFFIGFFMTFFKMFCTEEIHFKMYMPKIRRKNK
jgi:hypothetical protein